MRTGLLNGMKIQRKRKEIIMLAIENMAKTMRRVRREQHLSIEAFARKLNIATSATANYLRGIGNPRLDTLELLAKKCGVTLIELLAGQPSGWEHAQLIARAAQLFASQPPKKRAEALHLFLALVNTLSDEDRT